MSYTYLASPYTSRDKFLRADRYRAALRATQHLMENGEIVFCPVAYGHSLEQKLHAEFPYEYWTAWSKAMLAAASRLYVLTIPGWEASKGVKIEVSLALELGIAVTGFAFGPDAEDISAFDIIGEFGLALPRRQRRFIPIPDSVED